MSDADYTGDVDGKDPFGAAARIQRAAAREAARETWKWWLYGGLSLVPLVIAIVFLNHGRLDREQVRRDVVTEVAPLQSDLKQMSSTVAEIKPALVEVQQLGTLVAEVKQVGTLAAQVKGTASAIEEYGQRIVELQSRVATTEARQQQFASLSEDFTAFRSEQTATARRVEERQQRIQHDLGQLQEQVGKQQFVDPRVPDLMNRLQRMEKQVTPLLEGKIKPRSGPVIR